MALFTDNNHALNNNITTTTVNPRIEAPGFYQYNLP